MSAPARRTNTVGVPRTVSCQTCVPLHADGRCHWWPGRCVRDRGLLEALQETVPIRRRRDSGL